VIALFEAAPERWDGALYRSLRDDVRFRFAAVGPADVVREAGTPDVDGGVVLIEPFSVAAGDEDAFLAAWERLRAARAEQRGYLGTRLYRAEPGFVDFTRWSSPLMYARALKLPPVQEAAPPFPSDPALYVLVH
jgi:hypothetical protein